ncbi:MAG TPA: helix-turn-helix transcriptional regulator [Actinomycetota bacterium]|nr:helix-turn-helix transcriptional regulator [Actinomycetota bacterium]
MDELAPVIPTADAPSRQAIDAERRRELAGFLRTRRERLTPADVGLPPGLRRRTPGLRREEVAQLSGVGVTWYTWLEQGRQINASGQVLEAVARTLRLDQSERSHLFTLAGVADHAVHAVEVCEPAVRELVEAMHPYPAQVVSPRYDIVGWNRAQAALMGDYSKVPARYRNILWLLFTQPAWRDLIVEQEDVAYVVARFRANMAEHVGEPAWMELVRELSDVSPRFVELWERHDVAAGTGRVKRYLHPEVGLIRLVSTALTLSERPGVRVVAGTPADEESRAAMLRLADLGPWAIDWVLPGAELVPAAAPVA